MTSPITALHLGNFKAFGPTQHVPLKPITLIFGANSAGKSSVLHGLLLAHEASRTGTLEIHRTEIGGDSVDLGGFRQYCYRHDPGNLVEWSLDLNDVAVRGSLGAAIETLSRVKLSLHFGISEGRSNDGEERIKKALAITSSAQIRRVDILVEDQFLLKMRRRPNGLLALDAVNTEHPYLRRMIEAIILSATTANSVSEADMVLLDSVVGDLLPSLDFENGKFFPSGLTVETLSRFNDGRKGLLRPIGQGTREQDLRLAAELFLPRLFDALVKSVSSAAEQALERISYLGPLRSYPPRHLAFLQSNDPNWRAGGGQAWERVKDDESLRKRVNEWLGSKDRLQTPYELQVIQLIYANRISLPLSDGTAEITHFLFDESGIRLGLWDLPEDHEPFWPPWMKREPENDFSRRANLRRDQGAEDTQETLWQDLWDRWEGGEGPADYLAEKIINSHINDDSPRELVMVDQQGTTVSHRDVGIGISQVLPVLVAAYGSSNSILAIEQPEIHLHPALQSELADVFIESALGPNQNTLLLETHSEHVILRILRRIRETAEGELPEGVRGLRPEDVAVIYAKPDASGTKLLELRITEEGEFADKWPDGFFTERAKELF